jgi:tetratricopeptide (TPR) repeat protein
MEPLGTITMYYPFLKDETVGQLNSIMEEAVHYHDFALRLADRALQEESVTDLVFVACTHAWRLKSPKILCGLSERFKGSSIVQAWTLPLRKQPFADTRGLLDTAIDETEEDWMKVDLLFLKADYALYVAEVTEPFEIFEQADAILSRNEHLECLSVGILWAKKEYYFMRRMFGEARRAKKLALKIAENYDDRFILFSLLITTGSHPASERLEVTEKCYELAVSLGSPHLMAWSLSAMGFLSEHTGEYDLAIKCFEDSLDMWGYPETELFVEPMEYPCYRLSRIYAELGDGESALEWAENALDMTEEGSMERPYLYAQRAEALIMLDRLEEAFKDLDTCRKIAFRIGRSGNFTMCAIAEGYYEIARNNPEGAIENLERWFEYLPPCPYKDRILIASVRAETAACREDHGTESSGVWMDTLERTSLENELPGIGMLHAILRAELLLKQDRYDSARRTLQDGLKILDSPAVRSLRAIIHSMLAEIQSPDIS